METSNNNATSSPAPTGTSRRSGRVSKLPEKYIPDAPATTKRKRRDENEDEDAENDAPVTDEDESDAGDNDAAEDDDDDEVVEEASKRKKRSSQPARSRKPAAKKPKTNGDAGAHPVRLASRPKKAVRIAVERREGDGLFGRYSR